jgi:hypothetical protein
LKSDINLTDKEVVRQLLTPPEHDEEMKQSFPHLPGIDDDDDDDD